MAGLLKSLGWLEHYELAILDWHFKHRPAVPPDDRIALVVQTEGDVQELNDPQLSDRTLVQLLEAVRAQEPRAIGLDLYRDLPVPDYKATRQEDQQAYQDLQALLRSTPNLYGVEKAIAPPKQPAPKPNPILDEQSRSTATDLLLDRDGRVRRAYFYPVLDRSHPRAFLPSLGLQMALSYLEAEGIKPQPAERGNWMKLAGVSFEPVESHAGGYVGALDIGYPVLVNWRLPLPEGADSAFPRATVREVLNGDIPDGFFRDRVVLVGKVANSGGDFHLWPGGLNIRGIQIHAHLTSHVLGAALDGRNRIRTLSQPLEYGAIAFWSLAVALWGWWWRHASVGRSLGALAGGSALAGVGAFGSAYLAFRYGWWIPVISPLLGIVLAFAIGLAAVHVARLDQEKRQVQERAEQLARKLYEQRKQVSLAKVASGIAHQSRNSIGLALRAAEAMSVNVRRLQEALSSGADEDKLNQLSTRARERADDSVQQVERADRIIHQMLRLGHPSGDGKQQLDLNQLLSDSAEQFQASLAREFRFSLATNLDDEVGEVTVASSDLQQAVIELLTNSYKACTAKQQATGSDYKPLIELESKAWGDWVQLVVRDNGVGIDPQIREHVFKPYVSGRAEQGGTGIGLYEVHRIICFEHQGELEIASLGGGEDSTTVVAWIPRHPPDSLPN